VSNVQEIAIIIAREELVSNVLGSVILMAREEWVMF